MFHQKHKPSCIIHVLDLHSTLPNKSALMASKYDWTVLWGREKSGNLSRGDVIRCWNSLSSHLIMPHTCCQGPPPMLVMVMSDVCVNSSGGNNNHNWQLCWSVSCNVIISALCCVVHKLCTDSLGRLAGIHPPWTHRKHALISQVRPVWSSSKLGCVYLPRRSLLMVYLTYCQVSTFCADKWQNLSDIYIYIIYMHITYTHINIQAYNLKKKKCV